MESATRNLAVLFADVAGSTRLYETAGDAAALLMIGRCVEVMRGVCEERDGRVVKTIGDEVMAVFPSAGNAGRMRATLWHTQWSLSGCSTRQTSPVFAPTIVTRRSPSRTRARLRWESALGGSTA